MKCLLQGGCLLLGKGRYSRGGVIILTEQGWMYLEQEEAFRRQSAGFLLRAADLKVPNHCLDLWEKARLETPSWRLGTDSVVRGSAH